MLPLKTTIEDFSVLLGYMKSQVGWVSLDKIRKALPSKATDNRKLEAMRVVGLIERDKANVKVTDAGWAYLGAADDAARASVLAGQISKIQLYADTVQWMHFSNKPEPTRTEVANYWNDKHESQLEGAKGAALTDAAVFFLRLAAAAGLGVFIRAGNNRPDTYLRSDGSAIESFVLGAADGDTSSDEAESEVAHSPTPVPQPESEAHAPSLVAAKPASRAASVKVQTSPAIHVNLEIHIAANATANTVREIFMNMRKYVLDGPATTDEN